MSNLTEKTYWNSCGKLQQWIKPLQALIPTSGEVPNKRKHPALEKFRKAQNCYYDLYNNGLWNRAAEFRSVFGLTSSQYKNAKKHGFTPALYHAVEQKMDLIIAEAVLENQHQLSLDGLLDALALPPLA